MRNVGPFISAQRPSQFGRVVAGHTHFHNLMAAWCTGGQRRGARNAQPHTHGQWLARSRRRPGVQRLCPSPARTPRAAGADKFCDGECARRVLPLRNGSDFMAPRVQCGIEQCAAPHPLRSGQTIIGGATVRFIAVAARCERHRRGGELRGRSVRSGAVRISAAAQHRLPGDGAGRR
jgi:hypothetical protein